MRIPPLRLAKQGVLERDVLDLLLANNREPLNVRSDFEAVIGAIQKAIEFLHKIGQTLGVKELQLYLDEVLNYGERRMRDELKKIPVTIPGSRNISK